MNIPTDNINISELLYEKEKYKFFLENYNSLAFILYKNSLLAGNEMFFSKLGFNGNPLLKDKSILHGYKELKEDEISAVFRNADGEKIIYVAQIQKNIFGNKDDEYIFALVNPGHTNISYRSHILDQIFNNLSVIAGVINDKLELVYANDFLNKHFQLEQDYLTKINKYFNKRDISKWEKIIKGTIRQGKVSTDLLRLSNNSDVFFEVVFMPFKNNETKEDQVIFLAKDLKEVYNFENEKIFKRFAEKVNDCIIIWDKNQIHYVNPAFEKIFGLKPKEFSKNREVLFDILHHEDKQKKDLIFKLSETGRRRAVTLNYRILKDNNEIKWLWHRSVFLSGSVINADKFATIVSDITEQKELEFNLANVKSQQRAIMDNIPHLIWLKDSEGKYVTVNKAFSKYHGKNFNDIVGKTDFDLASGEIAEKTIRNDIEVMRGGKSYKGEDFSKSVEGNNWIETYKTPIVNENGEVTGITGIAMDITERKKMEVMIKDSEARFRSLLQNSSDAITILDRKGNIIYENAEQGKISKFSYEELWGKSVFNLIHKEDQPLFRDSFDEVLRFPQRVRSVEFRGLNINRKWVYVESILTNQLSNPAIRGIVVNSRDITERKLSELKERVYQDNLIFLSNSALELMGLSQLDNIYKYIADKMHEYLNNATIVTYSYNEDRNVFKAVSYSGIEIADLLSIEKLAGKKIIGSEIPLKGQISEKYDLGYLVQINETEEIANLLGVEPKYYNEIKKKYHLNKVYAIRMARDRKILGNILILTRNKNIIVNKHIVETFVHQASVALHRAQLEFELVQAKVKAEESDKLKSAFLANMSHEIRTPINGILGFIELIENDDTPESNRKKFVEIIYNNSKILVNLIDDIIDISKIEAGQIRIEKKDISLNILMNQIYTSFLSNKLFKDKREVKMRMKKHFTNDKSNIKTDPVRLRQVLTNLVGNAYKFTEKGYIEFGYRLNEKNNVLEFYVKDTGIGIPREKQNLIFDRFTQVDHSASRKYGGSGLGLAISKAIIELLDGEMSLVSKEGEGSEFKFTIPYEKAKTSGIERPTIQRSKINYDWSDKTLLIAEDDRFSFKFLETFLQQTKINIIHADDGKKAVEFFKNNDKIDLVLMDIQMPELNGYEATKQIKRIRKTPVIAQTANALEEEKQKCYDAGCDDYLTKPISIREMLAKMEEHFNNK